MFCFYVLFLCFYFMFLFFISLCFISLFVFVYILFFMCLFYLFMLNIFIYFVICFCIYFPFIYFYVFFGLLPSIWPFIYFTFIFIGKFRVASKWATSTVSSEWARQRRITKETWLVGKTNRPKFRLYKSHQSLVGAGIEAQPPSTDWPGRWLHRIILKRDLYTLSMQSTVDPW